MFNDYALVAELVYSPRTILIIEVKHSLFKYQGMWRNWHTR